ncbi:MAG TPA: transglycosylase SLT domain-containing protein [Burkholderiales bacterium]|nr:transglycosylase SLT domain-containing protein [Burkholderiales bacterium]
MRTLLACALFMIATLAWGGGQEDDFLAAREAYRVGDSAKLAVLAKRLQGYILQPYVAYWQLQTRLEDADPTDIRAFLAANDGSLLAERLRKDWLKLLGKNQQWDLFDAELPQLVGDDIEITCYSLQSRIRLDPQALREARPLWFVARNLPDSCNPLFGALVDAQMLSSDDLWTRIRLALEAGQVGVARRIAGFLPASQAPDSRLLNSISSNPAGYLEKRKFDFVKRAGRETTMFAVYRLARTAPPQAAAHWSRLEDRFSEDERSYVWGLIAYFGAMRHDPGALDWYAKAGDMSDVQLAWKARAALRARNWREVLAAIDAMTRKESADAGWRYWKARALKALGRNEEAVALLTPLADEFNFYGQLATEELGGKITSPAATFKPGAEEVSRIGRLPGIRRALALFNLDLRVDGVREWVWAIRGFDDRQLLAAAELALRNGIYDRVINTADKTVMLHDFSLRYIAPYRDVLKARTGEMGLDEAWVYGLIRQESRFVTGIRSSAGASGLMQLMPATAKWVAAKLGLKNWRWSQVTEVDTNISLGTYYLRHILDTLDDQPVLASAAYNAGPSRARRWRPDSAIEGAIYAETIPFNETRDYVKKVMSNATYYAHTFGEQLQSLKQRLGIIGPRDPGAEPALGDTP